MKNIYAIHLLFLFVIFLSAPTIVKLIDKNANIGIVYSVPEEEKSENSSSTVSDFVIHTSFSIDFQSDEKQKQESIDYYEFIIKSYDICVLSPPPDNSVLS